MTKLVVNNEVVLSTNEEGPTKAMQFLGEKVLPEVAKDSSAEGKKKMVDALCEARSEFIKSPKAYEEADMNKDTKNLYNRYCKNDLDYYYVHSRNSENIANGFATISKVLSECFGKTIEVIYEK